MQQVTITDRASEIVKSFRDEEHTNQIKAHLLDVVCSVIDDVDINGTMSGEVRLLSVISDLNDLIMELSKTSDN